jgi:ribosomal-protein-alanine N-acetyltransferase
MGSGARPGAAGLSELVVDRATSADLPEILALERACYSDPWPASAFASLPGNARVYFAVARDRSDMRHRVAGYVVSWFVLDEGELANLAVAKGQRGKGIGRMLLDAMLADAAARGTRQIYLEVRESNAAARRLYATRSFEEVGRRRQYYRTPPEDALILRRTL